MDDWKGHFRKLVQAQIGVSMDDIAMRRLRGVLEARSQARGCQDISRYIQQLQDPGHRTEFQDLANMITVGKTSFNRHPAQTRAVIDVIMPRLDAQLPAASRIRIWSAACSTGQEPYTLAMALEQAGWYRRRKIEILATDVNTDSLRTARSGQYFLPDPEKAPDFVRKHLEFEGQNCAVSQTIRNRIQFDWTNLASSQDHLKPRCFHVIICANVLIYFSEDTIRLALQNIVGSMAANSILFLGGTESLTPFDTCLSLTRIGDCYAYLHGDWNGSMQEFSPHAPASTMLPCVPAPVPTSQAEPVATKAVPVPEPAGPAPKEVPAQRPTPDAPVSLEGEIESAVERFRTGSAEEDPLGALQSLKQKHPKHPKLCRTFAMLLFSSKHFAEAYEAFIDAIDVDPLAFDLYFFQGRTMLALGQNQRAQEEFRRSLFLEPAFMFARYEFALTLHRNGEFQPAIREYTRAEQTSTAKRVLQQLKNQAQFSGESFWTQDSYLVHLCQANRERASQGLDPLDTGASQGE